MLVVSLKGCLLGTHEPPPSKVPSKPGPPTGLFFFRFSFSLWRSARLGRDARLELGDLREGGLAPGLDRSLAAREAGAAHPRQLRPQHHVGFAQLEAV